MEEERKSKLVAALLGIFLGVFGAHNFYLGYTKKAITQVALSGGSLVACILLYIISIPLMFVFVGFFTMMLGILCLFVPVGIEIWGLVEGLIILSGKVKVDARGIPLKE